MKKLLAILCMLPLLATAQKYPQHYFRNPLNIPILLAGNFGECRGGHFHSGLDIKTNGKENLPVFAAGDGYVSRIKMDKGGFGHALYVTHPNGYTTLYAHLNDFAPEIQKYLREKQYAAEKWDVDLSLNESQFPVSKGEQIAFSGNTGSSTAPHLHFEIRDTKSEHPLNPQLFGLEVKDNKAPVPLEIAIYDLNNSIYEQNPRLLPLKKNGNIYRTTADIPVFITGTGIGIHVNDYMDGSENTLNFFNAQLYVNDKLLTEITLDDIGYDVTRYMHAYADYKTKEQKDKWIQCLFRLKGNQLDPIYNIRPGEGAIDIPDGGQATVKINLTDNSGNVTTIQCILKGDNSGADSLREADAIFRANEKNSFDDPNVRFSLPATALYDDVYFIFSKVASNKGLSSVFNIHKPYVPIHNYFDLNIKPDHTIPFSLRDKIAMKYNDGKEDNGRAATSTDKGWYMASVRNFGAYSLVADTVAPVITPAAKSGSNLSKSGRVSFTIKDAITSVKKYRAELNGKWVLLEQHANNFFYEFDEHCPKGKNKLIITASDENNNTRKLVYTFTR
jgi:hypothetical protein